MKKEIEVAAKWWTDILQKEPSHDNKDAFQSAFANNIASTLKPLTEKQLKVFKEALVDAITKHIERNEVWDSALRVIGTDYGPDKILAEAAEKAKIDQASLRLPWKTLMWIDPGRVSVAQGYGAPVEAIYSE